MSVNSRITLAATLFLFGPVSVTQDLPTSPQSSRQSRLPYEIIVTPNVTLSNLEKLLVQIEDDFFEKFNELNVDQKYDVRCYEFVPTGSHIKSRVCDPNLFINAQGDNASEYMSAIISKVPPPLLMSRKDLRFQTRQDFEILQNKLEEMYRANLEFNSIGNALSDVKKRIEDLRNPEED